MNRPRRRPGRGGGILAKLLTVAAMLLIALALVDFRVRPAIEELIAAQAKGTALRTVNAAMQEELEQNGIAYGDIVHLTRDETGAVASVETDIVALGRLKTRMASAAAQELERSHNQSVWIPVGTLMGSNFLSGRGPQVEVRVLPAGYVEAELYNEFVSAGINQTLHRIMLRSSVQMVAVLPGYRVKSEVSTSFCVAETVIVGAIPEGYTIVGEDNRSSLSKLYDYQAG